jgi:hypothetical protein
MFWGWHGTKGMVSSFRRKRNTVKVVALGHLVSVCVYYQLVNVLSDVPDSQVPMDDGGCSNDGCDCEDE